ncbi:MAG: twin-arginine translocase subunit TatC [Dehalococcoidia bacterium]
MADRAQPLLEHFGEIKRRMIRYGIFLVLMTILAFFFYEEIFLFLEEPAREALNPATGGQLIFTDVTEFWGATAKICVIVGFALALPFLLWQVMMFLRPGLTSRERKYLYLMIPGGTLSFIVGVAFSYYIILPEAITFLLSFGGEVATPYIRVGSYVNLMVNLMFWMGIVFEIPIMMFFLAKIGIVSARWLGRQRRWAILMAFVMGALITPTFDPVNQVFVAGPVIVLFELGYWLARIAERSRAGAPARIGGSTGG